jgi:hypothetical protein
MEESADVSKCTDRRLAQLPGPVAFEAGHARRTKERAELEAPGTMFEAPSFVPGIANLVAMVPLSTS